MVSASTERGWDDEQRRVHAVAEPGQHPVGLGLAAQQLGPAVQLLGHQVPERPVASVTSTCAPGSLAYTPRTAALASA